MNTDTFITYLSSKNIRVRLEGDRVRCSGPKDVLTAALQAELAQRKAELIAYLRAVAPASSPADGSANPVP